LPWSTAAPRMRLRTEQNSGGTPEGVESCSQREGLMIADVISSPASHNGTTGSSHQVVGYAPSCDTKSAEPHGERSRSMGKNTRFVGLDVHAVAIVETESHFHRVHRRRLT